MNLRKLAVVAVLIASVAAWADMYRLRDVKRLDSNIYKASGGLIIKTRYCYHYAYGEDAVYDDEDRKIIWKDGDSPCDVEGIYR